MNRVKEVDGWRTYDIESNLFFPWYTRPFLHELIKWDIKTWKIFEYGAGDSTKWWKHHADVVCSVDTDINWAKKSGATYISDKETFLSYPCTLINEGKFDCIIIDGEPVEWRDECTEYALRSIKSGGIIIVDNYNQATVSLNDWPKTDLLLSSYEKHVYKETLHADWKTAYWLCK
jgi:hypothetical protein